MKYTVSVKVECTLEREISVKDLDSAWEKVESKGLELFDLSTDIIDADETSLEIIDVVEA